jgi:hypothetical protein
MDCARGCALIASCVSFPSSSSFAPCRRRVACLSCVSSRHECHQLAHSSTNPALCCYRTCASCPSSYAFALVSS